MTYQTSRLPATILLLLIALPLCAQVDLALIGGRVMDPETGLDATRNVGIRGDRIVEISELPIAAARSIDVSGLIVAPGFIDLHAHGQTNAANEYQAHDGVTTALELESGVYPLTHWLDSRRDNALVNYGATASHSAARAQAMQKYALKLTELQRLLAQKGDREDASDALDEFLRTEFAASVYDSLSSSEIPRMNLALQRELEAGALGVGLPVGYQPGATREEIFGLFEFAGEIQAPIFVHVRDPGIPGIQEVIANATITGAPLHIVHVNSMALGDIALAIDLVEAAQARGHDITTELYPYTAGSTSLESALFDEGWQQRLGNIGYADIQWQDTGERLTADSFERYREEGGVVIIHMMREEWIDAGIARESVMIASDGMPYAPGAHPRSAGTFSRVLGRYVRERGALNLMSALQKMTLMPADRLADIAPGMRLKGRLQVGADADITVFDAGQIIDTATFEADLSFSRGVEYVLVNGTLVVDAGVSVENVFPGRAIVGKYKR
ncbi:MAG: amidohydrolase family protein [Pseudomonadales bacterium]